MNQLIVPHIEVMGSVHPPAVSAPRIEDPILQYDWDVQRITAAGVLLWGNSGRNGNAGDLTAVGAPPVVGGGRPGFLCTNNSKYFSGAPPVLPGGVSLFVRVIRTNATTNRMGLVLIGTYVAGALTDGFTFLHNDNGLLYSRLKNATGENFVQVGALATATRGVVAMTYNSTTGYIRHFIDTVYQGQGIIGTGGAIVTPTATYIGRNPYAGAGAGNIGVVKVYDRTMSDAEVVDVSRELMYRT